MISYLYGDLLDIIYHGTKVLLDGKRSRELSDRKSKSHCYAPPPPPPINKSEEGGRDSTFFSSVCYSAFFKKKLAKAFL